MPRIRTRHDDGTLIVGSRIAAGQAVHLVQRLLARVNDLTEAGDDKQAAFAARAAQHAAITYGVTIDKALVLDGRPDRIVAHTRDLEDVLAALDKVIPGLIVDSTAEEIIDPRYAEIEARIAELPPPAADAPRAPRCACERPIIDGTDCVRCGRSV